MSTDDEIFAKAFLKLALSGYVNALENTVFRRVIKAGRAQLVYDYSGGSALAQTTQSLFLLEAGRFRLEEKTFSAITGLGGSEEVKRLSGTWELDGMTDQLRLVLSCEGRVFANWRLDGFDSPNVYLDGEPWRREAP